MSARCRIYSGNACGPRPARVRLFNHSIGAHWFERPVANGGLAMQVDAGVWFEEYPDANAPSHILNGHMWALLGIWDYYRVIGEDRARRLFDRGVTALKAQLPQYDADD